VLRFITHFSFIYQEWFGFSSGVFSLPFAANIAVMAIMNLINRLLLRKFSSVVLLRARMIMQCVVLIALVMVIFLERLFWLVAACGGSFGRIPVHQCRRYQCPVLDLRRRRPACPSRSVCGCAPQARPSWHSARSGGEPTNFLTEATITKHTEWKRLSGETGGCFVLH